MTINHRFDYRPLRITALKGRDTSPWDFYLKILYMFLQLVDLGLTLMAAQLGFPELNPYIRMALSSPLAMFVIKAVIPLIICWMVPGRYLIPAIALLFGVLAWNLQQLLQLAF
jgi:hypothetical protein